MTSKHKIIMISGKQGSGKTSIMNNIILMAARMGMNAMDVRFAETIYNIHDYIRETLRFRGIERPDKDGRLLQLLGTEWGRETIHPDIWVKACLGYINNVAPVPRPHQLFVISDCRFKNEFDLVDAFRVRLEAPKDVRQARCDGWRDTDTHISETDLDEYAAQGKFDLTIDTTSTKPDEVAKYILEEYGKYLLNRNNAADPNRVSTDVPVVQAEDGECGVEDGTGDSEVSKEVG